MRWTKIKIRIREWEWKWDGPVSNGWPAKSPAAPIDPHISRKRSHSIDCRGGTRCDEHVISKEAVLRTDQESSLPATVPAKKSIRGSRSAGWFTTFKSKGSNPSRQSQETHV
jgi:hypothetical protein